MIDPRAAAAIAEIDRLRVDAVQFTGTSRPTAQTCVGIIRQKFADPDPLLAKLEELAADWEAKAYKIEVQHGITGKTYAAELRKLIAEYNP